MTKSMPFYPWSVISLNDYKDFVTFETVTIFLAKTWILIQLDNLVIQHCSIKTLSLHCGSHQYGNCNRLHHNDHITQSPCQQYFQVSFYLWALCLYKNHLYILNLLRVECQCWKAQAFIYMFGILFFKTSWLISYSPAKEKCQT